MGMTFGWFIDAAILDSSRNLVRKISSLANAGSSTFSAITLPRRGLSALNTMLIPPRPSTETSRYPANPSPTSGNSAMPHSPSLITASPGEQCPARPGGTLLYSRTTQELVNPLSAEWSTCQNSNSYRKSTMLLRALPGESADADGATIFSSLPDGRQPHVPGGRRPELSRT